MGAIAAHTDDRPVLRQVGIAARQALDGGPAVRRESKLRPGRGQRHRRTRRLRRPIRQLLGAAATVVGFARSEDKLAVAKENGAHHTVNTRGKTAPEVQGELERLTGRATVDAVLDCVGSEASLTVGASILGTEGALTSVGLMGQRVGLPLFPFVSGEKSYFGSFWGNHNGTALVCASTSGLGMATARALCEDGARVVVTSRSSERAEEVAAALPNAIGRRWCSATVRRID